MNKRRLSGLLVLGCFGALLAACTPAAKPFECTDKIGCMTIAPGASVHIAYALVVAGPDAVLGEDSKRGVELAIDDKGMFRGHKIELTGEDTGCNAEGGQAAAQKLAADKTIVAVIGTSCSSEARVAAPVLRDAGFTMISPSNTAPDLTKPDKHVAGYMRTAHNDELQGAVAAAFAYTTKGIEKAATIHDGSIYSQSLAEVFAKKFKELGGEIVAGEAVQPTDTDMRPVLTNISAAGPQLIYYPCFTSAAAFITSQAKEVPEFIYELFPVLLQMKHRRGGDLSGGQQQQLAIGRALASRPRLLILDEPTEGIQPSVIKEIGAVIKKLAERGDMAILLVEQFYDFAAELADQYLVMSRGEIVQQGRGENMESEGVRGLVTI